MGGGDRLRPDRSFDTIACRADGFCEALAALELGGVAVVLGGSASNAVARALGSARDGGPVEVRRTLSVGADGRIVVERLRPWLSLEPAAAPCSDAESETDRPLNRPLKVVCNGFASPFLCRPLQMGADVAVEDLRSWTEPDLLSAAFPEAAAEEGEIDGRPPRLAVVAKTSLGLERFLDWAQSAPGLSQGSFPHTGTNTLAAHPAAWEVGALRASLRTLSLRTQRRCDTALVVATYLAACRSVAWVSYPGLASDPANDDARRTLEHGFGPVVAFSTGGSWVDDEVDDGFDGGIAVGPGDGDAALGGNASTCGDVALRSCDLTCLARGAEPGTYLLGAGLENALDVVASLERMLAGTCG